MRTYDIEMGRGSAVIEIMYRGPRINIPVKLGYNCMFLLYTWVESYCLCGMAIHIMNATSLNCSHACHFILIV